MMSGLEYIKKITQFPRVPSPSLGVGSSVRSLTSRKSITLLGGPCFSPHRKIETFENKDF